MHIRAFTGSADRRTRPASLHACLSQLFAQTRFYVGKFLMKELDFYLNLSPSPDVGPEMQVGWRS
jgi:hypothetical protein